MRSSSYHFSRTEEKWNGLRLWPEGSNGRGKEIYLFKYTIYHALIKYSSGISPELYREDQSSCDGHLGFTGTILYLFISTLFPEQATKVLTMTVASPLFASMLCPGLLSHLNRPQVAYCLNFDLYETERKCSLSQGCVNAVNDQSLTPSCSGHVQLQRLCVGLNPAAQQLCLQERREAAGTDKLKASETVLFFPVYRKSREGLASNSRGDFFI